MKFYEWYHADRGLYPNQEEAMRAAWNAAIDAAAHACLPLPRGILANTPEILRARRRIEELRSGNPEYPEAA